MTSEELTQAIAGARERDAASTVERASPGPWVMATSCSFRRIIDKNGREIIGGTVQRSDNHPDLHFANGGYEGADAHVLLGAPDAHRDRRALLAVIDQLLPDTSRYQWLREHCFKSAGDLVIEIPNAYDKYAGGNLNETLDTAIDRAIEGEQT